MARNIVATFWSVAEAEAYIGDPANAPQAMDETVVAEEGNRRLFYVSGMGPAGALIWSNASDNDPDVDPTGRADDGGH